MAENSMLTSLLPLVVLFAIFYFLVIRPQQKQQREHKNMLANLQKGDKIVTNGGLVCEVIKPEDDFIKVKLNDDVIVRIDRNFVAKKLDKIESSDEK
ncbi:MULTISPECIES: preprotein translocase subunit YajC [Campylobacter]|jgi:preprotein translocase subunit YajC|uniref:Sec translocon accessory complex subunit YajC n=1 Tax=Campylobacter vicugnae TaxID=1660076 RepID=A0A1X9T065_9BACT|nr:MULTISPECIES: preprotein translocase subunit YajC [Campylobacter]MCR8689455.1 preprotein translocase subunit YajC [Campylobacter sp. RM9264]MCR8701751.1 preprotein translocase subunit YajC [Campylobacter sp. RM12176]ARR01924.1 preprotein translocase subunit YajC [Campylobacter sp. RM8964]ARR03638.1 preprotein translocase subunit YajC [Campylobacter sp. RM12175]MBE6429313.1 preprotein translocase subunit YajC [Campylobacter sp.]